MIARGCGAAGSAPAWHAGGQGFESPQLHPSVPARATQSVASDVDLGWEAPVSVVFAAWLRVAARPADVGGVTVRTEAFESVDAAVSADSRQERLDPQVAHVLPWVAAVLSVLYACLATAYLLSLPADESRVMALIASASALGLGILAILTWRRPVPMGWAHPLTSMIILIAAANSFAHIIVTSDPFQTTNVLLEVVACGAGLLRRRWFAATLTCLWAGWLATILIVGREQSWSQWFFSMVLATVLSIVINVATRAGLERVHEARADAERMSIHDQLTDLFNRRGLVLTASRLVELARRDGGAVSCLFLDVDGLKGVNDRLGHDAGDELLMTVSTALHRITRSTDVVARWGGDEFVVVGLGTGMRPDELEARMRVILRDISPFSDEEWAPLVSCGRSSLAPWDEGDLMSLLDAADRDMYLRRVLRRGTVTRLPAQTADAPIREVTRQALAAAEAGSILGDDADPPAPPRASHEDRPASRPHPSTLGPTSDDPHHVSPDGLGPDGEASSA